MNVVTYLVEHNLANVREVAIAASQELGAPLFDLYAIQPNLEILRLVSEKTLRRRRVLPLVKRDKRLFVATSDPTNLHALDEAKFADAQRYQARRVPQDGHIKMRISKNRAIDFRLSSCPTLFGEKIVMRILDSSSATLGICIETSVVGTDCLLKACRQVWLMRNHDVSQTCAAHPDLAVRGEQCGARSSRPSLRPHGWP